MPFDRSEPSAANQYQAASAGLILDSHRQLVQRELLAHSTSVSHLARELYHAPFVVLAHDTMPDPVFFYANLLAQQLFEMTWQEMVRLPSRLSAEPLAREERQRLLDRVASHGYIDDYSGIRISRKGKRFRIERATVWNLVAGNAAVVGQAAAFGSWLPLHQGDTIP